ncbi:hypothetical protein ES703_58973 [subsurface metagenome]
MASIRNEKIAMILAVLPGVFGFLGIGHFYIGRIRRGVILLIGAWGLITASVLCFVAWSMSQMIIPPPGQPVGEPPAYAAVFLIASFVLFFGCIALWIWQIFDARAVCRTHNSKLSN